MSTFYEQLVKMSHLKAQITHTGGGIGGQSSWSGMIDEDVAFSGSATYSSPWEELGDAISDTINSAAAATSTVAGLVGAQGVNTMASQYASTRLKSITQTINVWKTSTRPTYNVNFTLINYKPGMNVLLEAARLKAMTMPSKATALTLEAPGGYRFEDGGATPLNTFSLRYGDWFRAINLNLLEVNFTASKTLVALGAGTTPLYVQVQAVLVPCQLTTAEDILSFYS